MVRQRHREWTALAFPPTVLCVVAVTEEAASATATVTEEAASATAVVL